MRKIWIKARIALINYGSTYIDIRRPLVSDSYGKLRWKESYGSAVIIG